MRCRLLNIEDMFRFSRAMNVNDRSVGPWSIRKGNNDFRMSSFGNFGSEVGRMRKTIESFSNRRSLIWDSKTR